MKILKSKKYIFTSKNCIIPDINKFNEFIFAFGENSAYEYFKKNNPFIKNLALFNDIKDFKNSYFFVSDEPHFQIFITSKLIKNGAKNVYLYSSKNFPEKFEIVFSFTDNYQRKKLNIKRLFNNKLLVLKTDNTFVANYSKLFLIEEISFYNPILIAIEYNYNYQKELYFFTNMLKEIFPDKKICFFNVFSNPIRTLMTNCVDFVLKKDNFKELFFNIDNLETVKDLYYFDKYMDVIHT